MRLSSSSLSPTKHRPHARQVGTRKEIPRKLSRYLLLFLISVSVYRQRKKSTPEFPVAKKARHEQGWGGGQREKRNRRMNPGRLTPRSWQAASIDIRIVHRIQQLSQPTITKLPKMYVYLPFPFGLHTHSTWPESLVHMW